MLSCLALAVYVELQEPIFLPWGYVRNFAPLEKIVPIVVAGALSVTAFNHLNPRLYKPLPGTT